MLRATGNLLGRSRRIWLGAYIAVFSLIGTTVWITVGLHEPPFQGLPNVALWIFRSCPAVPIRSRPVHIHTRRIGVMGISPLESAYLLSLLLAPPWLVIVSVLLGNVGYALFGPRRLGGAPPACRWTLLSPHSPDSSGHAARAPPRCRVGPRAPGKLACAAAALVISTATTVPTHVAVWLSGGGFDVGPFLTGLLIDLGFVVIQSGLVLIALLILFNDPALLWALVAPSLLLLVVIRSYQSSIEQNTRMQTLSAVVLALQRGETVGETLDPVLTELATLLRVELVQLVFHALPPQPGVRSRTVKFANTWLPSLMTTHLRPLRAACTLDVVPLPEFQTYAEARPTSKEASSSHSAPVGARSGVCWLATITLNVNKFTRSDTRLLDTIAAQIAAIS